VLVGVHPSRRNVRVARKIERRIEQRGLRRLCRRQRDIVVRIIRAWRDLEALAGVVASEREGAEQGGAAGQGERAGAGLASLVGDARQWKRVAVQRDGVALDKAADHAAFEQRVGGCAKPVENRAHRQAERAAFVVEGDGLAVGSGKLWQIEGSPSADLQRPGAGHGAVELQAAALGQYGSRVRNVAPRIEAASAAEDVARIDGQVARDRPACRANLECRGRIHCDRIVGVGERQHDNAVSLDCRPSRSRQRLAG